jgi:hypothetical protein
MQQKITKLSSKRGELEEKERAMLDLIQRQKELLMKKEEVAVELAKQSTCSRDLGSTTWAGVEKVAG